MNIWGDEKSFDELLGVARKISTRFQWKLADFDLFLGGAKKILTNFWGGRKNFFLLQILI